MVLRVPSNFTTTTCPLDLSAIQPKAIDHDVRDGAH